MNSLEALENISITFDEGGYSPTTLGAKEGHFYDLFKYEYDVIIKDLEQYEKLKEKETPKKLTTKKTDFLSSRTGKKLGEYILPFRYCPNCDECVNRNYYDIPNYCHNCGQKLDGSEDNE